MKLPIFAACLVAGSTWSIAFADQTTSTNPKTAQKSFSAQKAPTAKQTQASGLAATASSQGSQQLTQGGSSTSMGHQTGWGGTQAVGGGDDCGSADVITGTGTFAFDCSAATTTFVPAFTCGLGGTDVWFSWVAPSTAVYTFKTCGGTGGDSVLEVFAGSGCAGALLVCLDDFCGLQTEVNFAATAGSNYMLRIGGYNGANIGAGTFSLDLPPPPPTNDDCTGPVAIAGYGTFPYNNTGTTTGVDGQNEGLCLAFGTMGITNDVWFAWTAPATGFARVQLCGTSTMDSKVAVYGGTGCPAQGTAMACNDDSCGLQSRLTFPTVAGAVYTIQLGNYPGATGSTGSFTIDVPPPPPPPPPPCALDDGISENAVGWGAGGDFVWLQAYGAPATPWTVSSVQAAWGSLMFPGGIANGTPSDVFIYDDPTQDGDPNDAVLVAQAPIAVQGAYSDVCYSATLPSPVTMSGIFFVGCHLQHNPGQFPMPLDQTAPTTNPVWFFGDNTSIGAVANYATPSANPIPPFLSPYPGEALLRVPCSGSGGPATYFCDPGSAGVMACPCSNPPSGAGRGCDNSDLTGGGSISMSGSANLAGDTLVCTTANQLGSSFSIMLQGDSTLPGGAIQGQGVRCVDGNLFRLYIKLSSGGSITAPQLGDLSISAMSASFGDVIAAGSTRYYSVYYRDPTVLGGCPALSTYNTTSAAAVVWN